MTSDRFHQGELRLQEQTGMREKIDVMSQHMLRDFMPDQHRDFFEELEYIFLGTVGSGGLPHAVILTGPAGFVSSPDPKTLVIQTSDRADQSVCETLAVGQPVGVLGLDLSNRRRNRMHGRITALEDGAISIGVVQSYGNCPKYINLREISDRAPVAKSGDTRVGNALDGAAIDLVSRADTFFIASYVADGSGAAYEGVDISHRGGNRGFVSVDSPTQITIPDYKGNYLFNTFGNLLVNPDAGLLFADFETGDQLSIHGRAQLIEDAETIATYPGAQRLLRIQIGAMRHQSSAIPLRWSFISPSPVNPDLPKKETP